TSAHLATRRQESKRGGAARAGWVPTGKIPGLWRRSCAKWRTGNRRWKRTVNESEAPDANEEYLLYQTLLGTWPTRSDGTAEKNMGSEYVERIQAYMTKALNEAKLNTSWIQPNEEWLAATRDFVKRILEPGVKNKFLPHFLPVVQEIARLGASNSLAQRMLQLTP